MHERPARMIVSHMGSGKTGATLTLLRDLLDSFTVRRVLVVAPLRVARDTWPEEIETWAHSRSLGYAVAVGSDKERRAAVARDAEITITNRENLVWLAKLHGTPSKWPYDCVIIDESSSFKAGKKRTTKARVKRADGKVVTRKGGKVTRFGVLSAVRKYVSRIYLLTGTPGGLVDLWAQIYLVDQGERLGSTMTSFLDRWFDVNRYSHEVKPKPHAEAEIMERISDVMVSLPKLDLVPEPEHFPVRVKLPPLAMEQYRRFQRTLFSEPHDVEAVSQGVLTNKLLQFANGSMYREDGSIAPIHEAKLDALDDLIEQAGGQPVLVFYSFKFDLDAIRKRHPDAVVLNESATAVKDWNARKIKILLAHPASCAHGLNLQYGGHIAIWYGLTWSLELYQQANARLPRPGQTELVAIYEIVADGTVDDDVRGVLLDKGSTQDAIIEAVLLRLAA